MYQSGINEFGGFAAGGRGRVILLPRVASPSRFDFSRTFDRLADLDLAVDLGQRIGSRDWWLGLGLLATLSLSAVGLGTLVVPLPSSVRAPFTAAEADEARPDAIQPLASGATTQYDCSGIAESDGGRQSARCERSRAARASCTT